MQAELFKNIMILNIVGMLNISKYTFLNVFLLCKQI